MTLSTSFSYALTIGLTCFCFKYLLHGSDAMVSVCHSAALLLRGSFWHQNFQCPQEELYWYLFRNWNPQSSEQMQLHKLSPFFFYSATIKCGQEDIPVLGYFWSLPFCWDSAQCKGWPDAKGAAVPKLGLLLPCTIGQSCHFPPYKLPNSCHMGMAGVIQCFKETFCSVNAGQSSALNPNPQHQSLPV